MTLHYFANIIQNITTKTMQTITPSNNTTQYRFSLFGSQISICVSVLAGGGKKSRNDLVVVAEVDCCRVPYPSGCERGMAFHLFFFSLFFFLLFFACVDIRLGFMSLAGGYCHIMVSQSVSQPEGSWDVAGAEADHLDANKVGHEVI